MASALIHMAVAKKVNKILKEDEKPFLLGSIAPDVAKIVGIDRGKTHFVDDSKSASPNIKLFLKKYRSKLNEPFELGYYIHLVTDVLWFDEFLPNFIKNGRIRDKEDNIIKVSQKEGIEFLYSDYSNINKKLLDYYNFDLSLFYEPFDFPESHIEEVPSIYFWALISKMGVICSSASNQNSDDDNFIFDIEEITHFVEYATIYCLDEIKKDGIRYLK